MLAKDVGHSICDILAMSHSFRRLLAGPMDQPAIASEGVILFIPSLARQILTRDRQASKSAKTGKCKIPDSVLLKTFPDQITVSINFGERRATNITVYAFREGLLDECNPFILGVLFTRFISSGLGCPDILANGIPIQAQASSAICLMLCPCCQWV